ncbi:MAG: response regulator [Bacteroidota bacterium]
MSENGKSFKTSIWIVDDNENFCVILSELINRTNSFFCHNYYHSVKTVMRALRENEEYPEIILLDIKMPIVSGLEAIGTIKRFVPSIKIVMLTSYDDEKDIVTALKNGANGYLSKSTNSSDIIHSLERLREGGNVIDPIIAQKMIDSVIIPLKKVDYRLTKREKELIKLLIEGKSISAISHELGISFFTAETHRKNIFQKLDVHSTHALVAKSLQEGLTD